jgi:hypothetical protein
MRPIVATHSPPGFGLRSTVAAETRARHPVLVVADRVGNGALAAVCRSAAWSERPLGHGARMGLRLQRIFDVLACSTPVISDHLPEIEELLDGGPDLPLRPSSANSCGTR